uniref:Uncharacterized protein n=1 Tax=Anopheles minimus TaxID=112268 RepID=A0A182WIS0_9DIPT
MSWKQLSRKLRKSVLYCQQYWQSKLKDYAKYRESHDRDPSPAMQQMDFVGQNVHELLKRAKQLCAKDTTLPAPFSCSSENETSDESTLMTMKRETPAILEVVEILPSPPPTKRARRNAVDGDLCDTNHNMETAASHQPVVCLTRLPSTSTHISTVGNEEQYDVVSHPENIQTLPKQEWTTTSFWNISTEQRTNEVLSDNLPANLHAFGLFVSTTLNNFPTTQQITLKGKIFELLQNAELGK